MRLLATLVLVTSVVLGCRSTPFPPATALPAQAAATPADASPAPMRPVAYPGIVPAAGQPGFQVCADCLAPAPTPKTLAGAPAATVSAPAAAPAPAPTSLAKPVSVRYATSIPFAFNSARIDPAGTQALDEFVARLPDGAPASLLSVAGRTDSIGSRESNARIARARAQTVLEALRARLTPRKEEIRGEPLCCYIATNATAAGRADNRRVNVIAIVEIE